MLEDLQMLQTHGQELEIRGLIAATYILKQSTPNLSGLHDPSIVALCHEHNIVTFKVNEEVKAELTVVQPHYKERNYYVCAVFPLLTGSNCVRVYCSTGQATGEHLQLQLFTLFFPNKDILRMNMIPMPAQDAGLNNCLVYTLAYEVELMREEPVQNANYVQEQSFRELLHRVIGIGKLEEPPQSRGKNPTARTVVAQNLTKITAEMACLIHLNLRPDETRGVNV